MLANLSSCNLSSDKYRQCGSVLFLIIFSRYVSCQGSRLFDVIFFRLSKRNSWWVFSFLSNLDLVSSGSFFLDNFLDFFFSSFILFAVFISSLIFSSSSLSLVLSFPRATFLVRSFFSTVLVRFFLIYIEFLIFLPLMMFS